MSKIIVIGLRDPAELYTAFMIANWLEDNRPALADLAARLKLGQDLDLYDMATHPEKGDAMDRITTDTALVIALHLFGIDKLPGGTTALATAMDPLNCYNRDNINLLRICMNHRAPLVAVGDQPWLGLEKRTLMYGQPGPLDPRDTNALNEPLVYLYENREP